jgi:hypothetical protein
MVGWLVCDQTRGLPEGSGEIHEKSQARIADVSAELWNKLLRNTPLNQSTQFN